MACVHGDCLALFATGAALYCFALGQKSRDYQRRRCNSDPLTSTPTSRNCFNLLPRVSVTNTEVAMPDKLEFDYEVLWPIIVFAD